MIKLVRVDNRLVHGQVAVSWSRAISADCILVANDAVAADEMRQSMLRLSKPQGMKLVIKSVADSVAAINSGVTDKYKLLVVVDNVQDAAKLAAGCPQISAINLGVMPAKEGTRSISQAINISDQDEATMRAMLAAGTELEIRQVPTETKVLVTEKLLEGR